MQLSRNRSTRRSHSPTGTVWRLGATLLAALLMVLTHQATASGSATSVGPATQQYVYPLTVSISGPTVVFYNDPATWTALASYGTTPYTYTWYRNGVQVGTGSTYSIVAQGGSFTLKVVVRDASGATASATKSVTMKYECLHC